MEGVRRFESSTTDRPLEKASNEIGSTKHANKRISLDRIATTQIFISLKGKGSRKHTSNQSRRAMSVVGVDFGAKHSVIAAAGRGGVDVILNGNSQRLNP